MKPRAASGAYSWGSYEPSVPLMNYNNPDDMFTLLTDYRYRGTASNTSRTFIHNYAIFVAEVGNLQRVAADGLHAEAKGSKNGCI
jgi:hypothetical protein